MYLNHFASEISRYIFRSEDRVVGKKKKKLNFTTVSRDSSSVDYVYTFKAPCVKSVEFLSIQHTRVNCSFVVWRFRATAYRQFNAIGLNLVFLPRMNEESTCLDMILLVQLCFECNDSVD